MSYNKIIEELIAENEKLKSDINYQVNQKFEYFIETQQLKKRISNLVSENTKLQNDLYNENKKLKQELKEYRGF